MKVARLMLVNFSQRFSRVDIHTISSVYAIALELYHHDPAILECRSRIMKSWTPQPLLTVPKWNNGGWALAFN
jgi:hypothetical protein